MSADVRPIPKSACRILDLMVPMRDGVRLHTVVYLPATGGPFPVILVRTPYSAKNTLPAPNQHCLEAGIASVVQDCRGTAQSEGVFYPWHPEIADGQDCLDWLAAQDWCNGRIAMDGGSHPGATQWYAAFSGHPALVGITPHVAPTDCANSPQYIGGAFCLRLSLQWGLNLHYGNGGYEKMEFDWDKLSWGLPLRELDRQAGLREIPFWRDWIGHSRYDAYWQTVDVNRHYPAIKAPALVTGGWYDLYSRGTLESFVGMQRQAGSERARRFSRCIIGPWTHGAVVQNLGVGTNAELADLHATRLRFRENLLRHPDADPLPGEPMLRYFMLGANEWRSADTWPVPGVENCTLYLHSRGCANSRWGDGALDREAPGAEPRDEYLYDPRHPVPSNGGCSICLPGGAFDQSEIEDRSDVLVFTGPELSADLDVVGNVRVRLFAASSALDTDFTAKLIDLYPDGRAMNLCDGIVRARFRRSRSTPELLTPGAVVEYDIDCWDIANTFRAGHRIRLEVSSSNFPRFDRNPNTGHPLGEDSELRPARQTICHDADHPSCLILPVLA